MKFERSIVDEKNTRIAIIGLGYVGLPIAVAFSECCYTVGFDVNSVRIAELKNNVDRTLEVSSEDLKRANKLQFTSDVSKLKDCNTYIVTVPTPIDEFKNPDLAPLENVSETIGKLLNEGDIVIYESTVYPGATEEICVPILENISGLTFNSDFFVGYSPERINPGDKNRGLADIVKVTSGSTSDVAIFVDKLYSKIISAGTFLASSIKVAEAAKVIENTQRDINIALMNELAVFFDKLDISSHEVIEASSTKWNFLPFKPGLVGGHCIGVDPYYLSHKAKQIGLNTEIVLSGRRVNDNMAEFVANKLLRSLIKKQLLIKNTKILIVGVTFKENCPDIRNSKVFELAKILTDLDLRVDMYDPVASSKDVFNEYNVKLLPEMVGKDYSAVILAVPHKDIIVNFTDSVNKRLIPDGIVFDLKSALPSQEGYLTL